MPMAEGGNESYMHDKLYEAARWSTPDNATDIPSDGLSLLTPGDQSNVVHVAAQHGNYNFILTLAAQHNMDFYELLCKRNSKGETPLHLAAQSGCKKTVEVLFNAHNRGDQNNNNLLGCWGERDKVGNTPLHTALRCGHEDVALSFLEKDLHLVSLYNNKVGESLAYLAAQNFCVQVLRTALDYDRDNKCSSISFLGPFGQTVFHPARNLAGEIMSILVERRKPLLKARDNNGKTVLDYAVEENRDSIVKILLKEDSTLAYLHDIDGLTPLHKAASKGLLLIVQTILELSPQSINIRDKSRGQTALHIVKMDPCSLEECLTNTRMRELINEVDNDGNTPLHLALMNSDKATAEKFLLVKGINWKLTNKQGHRPMDLCTCDDQIPLKLKSLVAAGKADKETAKMRIFFHEKVVTVDDVLDHNNLEDCLSFRGPGGDTILHIAARNGNMKIITREEVSNLARDSLLSGQNSNGETPLHLAAEYGRLEVVNFILSLWTNIPEVNAHQNLPNNMEIGAAGAAMGSGSVEVKPWRIKAANGDTPAHKALRNRHDKVALVLVRHDPELIRFINNEKESLLFLAVENRCFDVIEDILSEYGSNDTLITSGIGGRNFFHAVSGKNARSITLQTHYKKLIERQPHLLKQVDDNGKTPLHQAIEDSRDAMACWLLEQDKSAAFVYDNEGFTPLLRSAVLGSSVCIRHILNLCPQSADLRDLSNNRTALHLVREKPSAHVKLCMKHKLMKQLINETDKDGNTALHCAILDGDIDKALDLLKTPGVNWKIRNKQQLSPLDLARQIERSGNTKLGLVTGALRTLDIDDRSLRRFIRTIEADDKSAKKLLDCIAVVAALLASVTFVVAFTIPGGYDPTTGKAIRIKERPIQIFLLMDMLATLTAMTVLGGYTFGRFFRFNLKGLVFFCLCMLEFSISSALFGFFAGVYAIGSGSLQLIDFPMFMFVVYILFFILVRHFSPKNLME